MFKANVNKQALFGEADRLRQSILGARTLADRNKDAVTAHFKLALSYNSTAIDGNCLDEHEVREVIKSGLAIGGKPLKDHYEILGHTRALDYIKECAKYNPLELNEEVINHLHLLFYAGVDIENAGHYKEEQNYIEGTDYVPPSPKVTPMLMKTYINDMNMQKKTYHPIEYAAILHKRLLDVHPFFGGNGCIARLLMNLVLLAAGYGYCNIPASMKDEYMDSLRAAQLQNDSSAMVCLVASCLIDTQKQYARHLNVQL